MDRDSSAGLIDLRELRYQWKLAVCFKDAASQGPLADVTPRRCWFGENVPWSGYCSSYDSGVPQGAHWLKRQLIERELCYRLDVPIPELKVATKKGLRAAAERYRHPIELIWLAAWDPRLGVPSCTAHHNAFDLGFLVVDREQVPVHVEAYARDWGFETALEDRNPAMGAGI